MYDAGKEDYLRPSEHIGLDWIMCNLTCGQLNLLHKGSQPEK